MEDETWAVFLFANVLCLLQAWLAEINEYAQDNVVIMLLGNKSDMMTERMVRREDGERLAKVTIIMTMIP